MDRFEFFSSKEIKKIKNQKQVSGDLKPSYFFSYLTFYIENNICCFRCKMFYMGYIYVVGDNKLTLRPPIHPPLTHSLNWVGLLPPTIYLYISHAKVLHRNKKFMMGLRSPENGFKFFKALYMGETVKTVHYSLLVCARVCMCVRDDHCS